MPLPQPDLGQGSCQFSKRRQINGFSRSGKFDPDAEVSRPGDGMRTAFCQVLVLPTVDLSSSGNRSAPQSRVSVTREKYFLGRASIRFPGD